VGPGFEPQRCHPKALLTGVLFYLSAELSFSGRVSPWLYHHKSYFMKKPILLLMLLAGAMSYLKAQIKTPALSPGAKIQQKIGLVDVTLEYSRPSVKGREIFGDLVPYDKIWRTGANDATKITFSDDVKFGGADVKKGEYALLTKPGKQTWTLLLYPYTSTNWTSYGESDVTPVSVTADVKTMPKGYRTESLLLSFDGLTNSGANFNIAWDDVQVSVPVVMNTDATVEASIASVMAGPSAYDYFAAAQYYYNEKKDMKQALEWVNKSIEMGNEKYWVLRVKSLIQHELGDNSGAMDSALKSMELAKKAGSDEYIRLNEESLSQWRKG
jgi:hypothetical protein